MDHSQYKYGAMSNLVLSADRRTLPRRDNEPTGEPETLAGKINVKEMGARAGRTPATLPQKPEQTLNTNELQQQRKRKRDDNVAMGARRGYTSVLDATEDLEGLTYRPRTKETRETYELILSFVQGVLGDQSQDIVRSAGDAILEILKSDALKDYDRKKEVEGILGDTLSSEKFAQLIGLGKKITDYGNDEEGKTRGEDGELREGEFDDDMGVAVVFDEEEDAEDDEDGENYNEVRDISDDEDGIEGVATAEGEDGQGEDDMAMIGQPAAKKAKKTTDHSEKDVVAAQNIDAFWLQRTVATYYPDPQEVQEKTSAIMGFLESDIALGQLENELMDLIDYDNDKFDLVRLLTRNREKVVWCTKLARAEDAETKKAIEGEIQEKGLGWILREVRGETKTVSDSMDVDAPLADGQEKKPAVAEPVTLVPKQLIDLDSLVFTEGNHLMANKKVKLPDGSFKKSKKGYEEVHVPAPKQRPLDPGERLVPITEMPEWTHAAFKGAKTLNRIQSRLYPACFGEDENVLLCAPTGAGKTNVAMLCILNELRKYRDEDTGAIRTDDFKIVYIAPLKALVQEMVGNFSTRLETYGIKVAELTGDRQLTKQQIAETQVIVTTPEKWDVITRKATDTSYTNLVRLIIIDEIHLLHDERGPVLESIVGRTIRRVEQTLEPVRLVGLSATLPNYADVATFLRVDPKKGLFYFDSTYRPCPLKQEFIGITEKKAIKRLQTMNEVTYEKVMENAGKNQMLIFVHSRKETAKTAKFLKDKALEEETITQILRSDAASREILQTEADSCKDAALKELMPYGFGIHHAGMTRADRTAAEELFAAGYLQVLVCTATLAWGVNLPAHTVIIKGTQIYSPDKGRWTELSPQDVLQMLGRAGRPQYDTFGEGIIITSHNELQYYLSLLNQQLPIESQLMSKLADNLNAEIVLGTVRSREEAVQWLGYSYLYVRMLRSPALYSVGVDYADDTYLEQKRVDLIHSAATVLAKSNLIKYDLKTGRLQSTEVGRIASHYYITHDSMATYNQHLKPTLGQIELFRVFALSGEFKYIPVREEEKLELSKLLERVPVPVKENIEEPSAKINVLLQSYISRLKLDGFALVSDMVYVTQSAGRILRAIFEICLKRGWSAVAKQALDMCKMVEKRMWPTMTPLRQFTLCPVDVIRKVERKDLPWGRYFDFDPPELGELIGIPKAGKLVHQLVHQFPKLELSAQVQPITRSLLNVELTITPDFEWNDAIHGNAEAFWVIVEDVDGEEILFHESFILRKKYAQDDHVVTFSVAVVDPLPPNYFITVVSDRWMHSETKLAVSFKHLILPDKFPAHTPLLDLQPLPVSALRNAEFVALYSSWLKTFNKIQTQVFNTLYTTDENVFIGAPTGSGKTVCAEFAILKLWSQQDAGKTVYVAPMQEIVDQRFEEWQDKFANIAGGREVVALTGELSADLKLIERGDLILATPEQWDVISRRWKQRKNVQAVSLFIADEMQLIGGQGGPTYEVVCSRMRYIAAQLEKKIRIIGLSVPLASARDLGEWIGATSHAVYNFAPVDRPTPLEIHIQSFSIPHFPSMMFAMTKPTYLAITNMAGSEPSIVFLPSRKQCRQTALDLLMYCVADGDEDRFLAADLKDILPHLEHLQDKALAESLSHGIGFYHEALSKGDKNIVQGLFSSGAVQVLLVSRDACWSLKPTAHLIVIMGTQFFEGKEHRYIDYPVSDILQMMGRASRPQEDDLGRAVLMTPAHKKDYYRKFLNEALPLESYLHMYLHDAFVAETTTKTIENKQDAVDWLTWTLFYRRLVRNPSFYGLQDTSHQALSDFMSDLVETTVTELVDAKVVALEDDDMTIEPLNLGMISAYYSITYVTMQTFALSLTEKTKLKGLLEIVTSAAEFETIPIRHHEDIVLRRIYDRVPVKVAAPNYEQPQFKAFVLLQAHFSRLQLPADLATDQQLVLSKVLNLLSSCVDVVSSEGYLTAATNTMELSQMCVQAMWDRDSPLKQIPYFTNDVIDRCKTAGVESVFDLMDLEDDDRNNLLQMNPRQLGQVASFVNKYPGIDVSFEIEDPEDITTGTATIIKVNLEREVDEDEEVDTTVHAPFYPGKKMENWWIVIGDPATKQLLSIKRVTLAKRLSVRLDFIVPTPGKHSYRLLFFSDSYVGCDQELAVDFEAAQGEEEEEDEDEEMEE
ncbi:Pre-mRNA-splicing helicase BRR2 [Saitoella coloradoensis]